MMQNILSLISILAVMGCAAVSAQHGVTPQQGSGVGVFESEASGFHTKTYFYDNGEQVVVFDTQFTEDIAEKFVAFIRAQTSNPITHVVLTHPNPDKFNGLSVFKKLGAQVVASEATAQAMPGVHDYKKYYFVHLAKMFTDDTYPQLETVDQTFGETYSLQLENGEVIELKELSEPGVSSNQTVAYLSVPNALIVGDLVHHQAHAWLEGGIVNGQPHPTLDGWIADLEELETEFGRFNPTVLGGRGIPGKLQKVLPEQIAYLLKAHQLVAEYIKTVSNLSELQGPEAQKHYQQIQLRFEQAFPTAGLSYLIGYGVYGLMNQQIQPIR